jgi:hypothetical protein
MAWSMVPDVDAPCHADLPGGGDQERWWRSGAAAAAAAAIGPATALLFVERVPAATEIDTAGVADLGHGLIAMDALTGLVVSGRRQDLTPAQLAPAEREFEVVELEVVHRR